MKAEDYELVFIDHGDRDDEHYIFEHRMPNRKIGKIVFQKIGWDIYVSIQSLDSMRTIEKLIKVKLSIDFTDHVEYELAKMFGLFGWRISNAGAGMAKIWLT